MITLLKLGGSLITDKKKAHTVRSDVLHRLAKEIRSSWEPTRYPLIIGHGSGSFGHFPAKKYGTRSGVYSEAQWLGFAEVHSEATSLNRYVTDILREEGLPILSFVPMDNIRTENHIITQWDTSALEQCLSKQIIPMIFGDTVFDSITGGTILSTEDIFLHLCNVLDEPVRILLAGLEEGVWADFPVREKLLSVIYPDEDKNETGIKGSEFTDVTGGMNEKVHLMKSVIRSGKAGSAVIFSGETDGNVQKVLNGERTGTLITKSDISA